MAVSSQSTPRPEPRQDQDTRTGPRSPDTPEREVVFTDWASI